MSYTLNDIGGNGNVLLATWVISNTVPTGDEVEWTPFADRCVQMAGTFNGATITVEGSNDGSNWHALSDPQGNPLAFTTGKIEQVLEITRYMRPKMTSGSGANVTVSVLLRRMTRN